jgi:hypothetical protein
MTTAQWIWEYEALVEKEKGDIEKVLELTRYIKTLLIKLLGLDILVDDEGKEEGVFIPYAILGARREMAKEMFERLEDDHHIAHADDDQEFEELSAKIAAGEDLGDMEPILDGEAIDRHFAEIEKKQKVQDLQKAGIKIVPDRKPTAHIKFDREAMLERARDTLRELDDARKNVEKQLQEDQRTSAGMQMIFDDDDA